jgi:3-oxoacyl-(acyl-carrier-protein) synthase
MTGLRDKLGRPIVLVTGMGIVTSLGAGKTDNWAKLTAGESGIRSDRRFEDHDRRNRRSNQLSKRSTAILAAGCKESGFVVGLIMAWSPVRRANVG